MKKNKKIFLLTIIIIASFLFFNFIQDYKFKKDLVNYESDYTLYTTYLIMDKDKTDSNLSLSDAISKKDEALLLSVHEHVPILKDGSEYYADFSNAANDIIFNDITDVTFSKYNNYGEALNDLSYSKKSKIVKIPKKYIDEMKKNKETTPIQIEFVSRISKSNFRNVSFDKTIKKYITKSSKSKYNGYDLTTKISISNYNKGNKIKKDNIEVYINNSNKPVNKEMLLNWNSKSGVLEINQPVVLIKNVKVKIKSNKTVKAAPTTSSNMLTISVTNLTDTIIRNAVNNNNGILVTSNTANYGYEGHCTSQGITTDGTHFTNYIYNSTGNNITSSYCAPFFLDLRVFTNQVSSGTALTYGNLSGDVSIARLLCADNHTNSDNTRGPGSARLFKMQIVSVDYTNNLAILKIYSDPAVNNNVYTQYAEGYMKISWPEDKYCLRVRKTDTSNNPISGVVFGLYNSSKQRINWTPATDSNGYTVFKNLAKGTYYVKEQSVPNGYLMIGDGYSQITENNGLYKQVNGECPTSSYKQYENAVKKYCLKIKKVDGETNQAVKGASLRVTINSSSNNLYTKTVTTGSDGIAIFSNISLNAYNNGTISVAETGTPSNYYQIGNFNITDKTYLSEMVYNSSTKTYSCTSNQKIFSVNNYKKKYCLKIKKVKTDSDGSTNTTLSNVDFGVKNITVNKSYGTITTNDDGLASLVVDETGNFRFTEKSGASNAGLKLLSKNIEVTNSNLISITTTYNTTKQHFNSSINSRCTNTSSNATTIKNSPNVLLFKKTNKNGNALSGAKFSIVNNSTNQNIPVQASKTNYTLDGVTKNCYVYDSSQNNSSSTHFVTDTNGEVCVVNLSSSPAYVVKETEAPTGYKLNPTSKILTSANDNFNSYSFIFEDKETCNSKIHLKKENTENEGWLTNSGLEEASFEICQDSNCNNKFYGRYDTTTTEYVMTDNDDANTVSEIPGRDIDLNFGENFFGTVYIREKNAPISFYKDNTVYSITFTDDNCNEQELVIKNTPRQIILEKKDIHNYIEDNLVQNDLLDTSRFSLYVKCGDEAYRMPHVKQFTPGYASFISSSIMSYNQSDVCEYMRNENEANSRYEYYDENSNTLYLVKNHSSNFLSNLAKLSYPTTYRTYRYISSNTTLLDVEDDNMDDIGKLTAKDYTNDNVTLTANIYYIPCGGRSYTGTDCRSLMKSINVRVVDEDTLLSLNSSSYKTYKPKNGKLVINRLPIGTYYIVEEKSTNPSNFILPTNNVYSDFLQQYVSNGRPSAKYEVTDEITNTDSTKTISNIPTQITFSKYDNAYQTLIKDENAVNRTRFNVYKCEDNECSEENRVLLNFIKSEISDDNFVYNYTDTNSNESTPILNLSQGKLTMQYLPAGITDNDGNLTKYKYVLVEIDASDSYYINKEPLYFELGSNTDEIVSLNSNDDVTNIREEDFYNNPTSIYFEKKDLNNFHSTENTSEKTYFDSAEFVLWQFDGTNLRKLNLTDVDPTFIDNFSTETFNALNLNNDKKDGLYKYNVNDAVDMNSGQVEKLHTKNGSLTITNLPKGYDYYLEEIKVPNENDEILIDNCSLTNYECLYDFDISEDLIQANQNLIDASVPSLFNSELQGHPIAHYKIFDRLDNISTINENGTEEIINITQYSNEYKNTFTKVIENNESEILLAKYDQMYNEIIKDENQNATFKVYRCDNISNNSCTSSTLINFTEYTYTSGDKNGKKVYRYSKNNASASNTITDLKLSDGLIDIEYLPVGTETNGIFTKYKYYLVETSSPKGYFRNIENLWFEMGSTTNEITELNSNYSTIINGLNIYKDESGNEITLENDINVPVANIPTAIYLNKNDYYNYFTNEDTDEYGNSYFDTAVFNLWEYDGENLKRVNNLLEINELTINQMDAEYKSYFKLSGNAGLYKMTDSNEGVTDIHTNNGSLTVSNLNPNYEYYIEEVAVPSGYNQILPENCSETNDKCKYNFVVPSNLKGTELFDSEGKGHPIVYYKVASESITKVGDSNVSVTSDEYRSTVTKTISNSPTEIIFAKYDKIYNEIIRDSNKEATFNIYRCLDSNCTESNREIINFVLDNNIYKYSKNNRSTTGTTTDLKLNNGYIDIEYLPIEGLIDNITTKYKYILVETRAPQGHFRNLDNLVFELGLTTSEINLLNAKYSSVLSLIGYEPTITDYTVSEALGNAPTAIYFNKNDFNRYFTENDQINNESYFDSAEFVLWEYDGENLTKVTNIIDIDTETISTFNNTVKNALKLSSTINDGLYKYVSGANGVNKLQTTNGAFTITNLSINKDYYLEEVKVPEGYNEILREDCSETNNKCKYNFIVPNNIKGTELFDNEGKGHPVVHYKIETTGINESTTIYTNEYKSALTETISNTETEIVFAKYDGVFNRIIKDEEKSATFNIYKCLNENCTQKEIINFVKQGDLYRYSKNNASTSTTTTNLKLNNGYINIQYLPVGEEVNGNLVKTKYVLVETEAPNGYFRRLTNVMFEMGLTTGEIEELNSNNQEVLNLINAKEIENDEQSVLVENMPSVIYFKKEDLNNYYNVNNEETYFDTAEFILWKYNGLTLEKVRLVDVDRETINALTTSQKDNLNLLNKEDGLYKYDSSIENRVEKLHTTKGSFTIIGLPTGYQYFIEEVKVPEGYNEILREDCSVGNEECRYDFNVPNNLKGTELFDSEGKGHPVVHYNLLSSDDSSSSLTEYKQTHTKTIKNTETEIVFAKYDQVFNEIIKDDEKNATFKIYRCDEITNNACTDSKIINFKEYTYEDGKKVYRYSKNNASTTETTTELKLNNGYIDIEYLPVGQDNNGTLNKYKYYLVEESAPKGYYRKIENLWFEMGLTTSEIETLNETYKTIVNGLGIETKENEIDIPVSNMPTAIYFNKNDTYGYFTSNDQINGESYFDSAEFVLWEYDGENLRKVNNILEVDEEVISNLSNTYKNYFKLETNKGLYKITEESTNQTNIHTTNGKLTISNLNPNNEYFIEEVKVPEGYNEILREDCSETNNKCKYNFIVPNNIKGTELFDNEGKGHPVVYYKINANTINDQYTIFTDEYSNSLTKTISNTETEIVFVKYDGVFNRIIKDEEKSATFNIYKCLNENCTQKEIINFVKQGDLYRYSKNNASTSTTTTNLKLNNGYINIQYLPVGEEVNGNLVKTKYVLVETEAPNGYFRRLTNVMFEMGLTTKEIENLNNSNQELLNMLDVTVDNDEQSTFVLNMPTALYFNKKDFNDYYNITSDPNYFDTAEFILWEYDGTTLKKIDNLIDIEEENIEVLNSKTKEYFNLSINDGLYKYDISNNSKTKLHTTKGTFTITNVVSGYDYYIEEVKVPNGYNEILPTDCSEVNSSCKYTFRVYDNLKGTELFDSEGKGHPVVHYKAEINEIVDFDTNIETYKNSVTQTIKNTESEIVFVKYDNIYNEIISDEEKSATFNIYKCLNESCSEKEIINFIKQGNTYRYSKNNASTSTTITDLKLNSGYIDIEYLPIGEDINDTFKKYKYLLVETKAPKGYYRSINDLWFEMGLTTEEINDLNSNYSSILGIVDANISDNYDINEAKANQSTTIYFTKEDIYSYYDSSVEIDSEIFDEATFNVWKYDGENLVKLTTFKDVTESEINDIINKDSSINQINSSKILHISNDRKDGLYKYIRNGNTTDLHTYKGSFTISNLESECDYYIEEVKAPSNFILDEKYSYNFDIPNSIKNSDLFTSGHPIVHYYLKEDDNNINSNEYVSSVTKILKNSPSNIVIVKYDGVNNQIIRDTLKEATFNIFRCLNEECTEKEIINFVKQDETYRYSKNNDRTLNTITDLKLNSGYINVEYLPVGEYDVSNNYTKYKYILVETKAPKGYYRKLSSMMFEMGSTTTEIENINESNSVVLNLLNVNIEDNKQNILEENLPIVIYFYKEDIYKYYTNLDYSEIENNQSYFDTAEFALWQYKDGELTRLSLTDVNVTEDLQSRYGVTDGIYNLDDGNNDITKLHTHNGKIIITGLYADVDYYIEEIKSPTGNNFILPSNCSYTNEKCKYEFDVPTELLERGHPLVHYNMKNNDEDVTSETYIKESVTKVISNTPTRVLIEKRDSKYGYLIDDENITFNLYRCEKNVENCDINNSERVYFEPRIMIENADIDSNIEVYKYSKNNENNIFDLHPYKGKLVLRYLSSDYKYLLVESSSPKGYNLETNNKTTFEVSSSSIEVEANNVINRPTKLIIRKYDDKTGELLTGAKFKIYKVDNYDSNILLKDQEKTLINLKTIRDGVYENRDSIDTDVITTCTNKLSHPCSEISTSLVIDQFDFKTSTLGNKELQTEIKEGEALIQYLDYDSYYIIEEVKAPSGYKLSENIEDRYKLVYIPNIQGEETIEQKIINTEINYSFYKYDEYNNLLDGSVFKLQKLNKNLVYEDVKVSLNSREDMEYYYKVDENSDNYEIQTKNGSATIYRLSEGQYRIIEIKAAEGKELPIKTQNVATFFVNDEGVVHGEYVISNKAKTNRVNVKPDASAELIVNIQTGQKIIRYGLIISSIILIITVLNIIKRKVKNEE